MIPFPIAGLASKALGIAAAIPWWAWVMAILVAWGGCARRELKVVRTEFDTAKTAAAAARAKSELEAATETARRLREQKEILDASKEADTRLRAAQAARAAADGTARKLRDRLVALDARACGGDPAAPAGSASAAEAADLSAYVRRRLDEARDGVADFAEGAAGAGAKCERLYDSLKPAGR